MTTLITAAKETKIFWDLRSSVWSKYKGRGGGSGPPLDPPMNRKASGLRCKFATKLMTCSPVLLFSFHQELINAQVAGLGTSNAERKPRGRCYAGIGCTNSG